MQRKKNKQVVATVNNAALKNKQVALPANNAVLIGKQVFKKLNSAAQKNNKEATWCKHVFNKSKQVCIYSKQVHPLPKQAVHHRVQKTSNSKQVYSSTNCTNNNTNQTAYI